MSYRKRRNSEDAGAFNTDTDTRFELFVLKSSRMSAEQENDTSAGAYQATQRSQAEHYHKAAHLSCPTRGLQTVSLSA